MKLKTTGIGAKDFIYGKYPHLKLPSSGKNPIVDFELDTLCEWFEEYKSLSTPLKEVTVNDDIGFSEYLLSEGWNKYSDSEWVQRVSSNITGTNYKEYVRTTEQIYSEFKSLSSQEAEKDLKDNNYDITKEE